MDEIEIKIGYRRRIEFAFLKPDGTPGPIDGPADIETTDPDVIVPVDNKDGKSYYARCVGAGSAQVLVRADADLGAGVKTVEKALFFRGVDVMASQVQTTVGEEEQDPDFDGGNHVDPLPGTGTAPEQPVPAPSDPAGGGVASGTGTADQGGTAPVTGAGDAGPTPPAPGDAGAPQGGGDGPQPATQPAAGT